MYLLTFHYEKKKKKRKGFAFDVIVFLFSMSILFIASLSSQHSLKIGTYLVSKPLFPLRCEIRSRVYCDIK